jgi:hypothetical protein
MAKCNPWKYSKQLDLTPVFKRLTSLCQISASKVRKNYDIFGWG